MGNGGVEDAASKRRVQIWREGRVSYRVGFWGAKEKILAKGEWKYGGRTVYYIV